MDIKWEKTLTRLFKPEDSFGYPRGWSAAAKVLPPANDVWQISLKATAWTGISIIVGLVIGQLA